jgi:hypothetical protein
MGCIDQSGQELYTYAKGFTVEALCPGHTAENIKSALRETERDRQRRSPLQPKLMMWLMLCLPIFRSESIPAVLARLISGLRGSRKTLSLKPVSDGAIAHARRRLGVRPLRHFFQAQAREIRPAPSFKGLRVWAFDGTSLTMPDTEENRRVFGLRKAGRGRCAFPDLKAVALQDTVTRQFRDVRWNQRDASERDLAASMLGHLGEGDLVLLDRGLYAAWFFDAIRTRGSHFLGRVPAQPKLRPIRGTSRRQGDYLACMEAPVPLPEERWHMNHGKLVKYDTLKLVVRVIEYRIRGFERVRLVTSLRDRSITAMDLVLQYHRRWDIELAFDELKTHQSSTAQGTPKTTFRSHTPRNVMQEAYALAAAYNLLRDSIARAADRRSLNPHTISFVETCRAITHMIPRMRGALASDLRLLHEQLLDDLADAQIDRPRRPRRYPRVVKQKMSNFKRKRPHHRQQIGDFRSQIRIGA